MCEVLPGLSFQQLEIGMVIKATIKAVKKGRVEFVIAILNACPELVWCVENSTERNIFMLAALHRQEEVFRLLCKSAAKNSKLAGADKDSNSILHIAAMFEPSAKRNPVPGAAFLMQREAQWYKVISLTLCILKIISMMTSCQFSLGFMINGLLSAFILMKS